MEIFYLELSKVLPKFLGILRMEFYGIPRMEFHGIQKNEVLWNSMVLIN